MLRSSRRRTSRSIRMLLMRPRTHSLPDIQRRQNTENNNQGTERNKERQDLTSPALLVSQVEVLPVDVAGGGCRLYVDDLVVDVDWEFRGVVQDREGVVLILEGYEGLADEVT